MGEESGGTIQVDIPVAISQLIHCRDPSDGLEGCVQCGLELKG